MGVKKETQQILQRCLESVNNVLGTQLELDYYPAMGGYLLESKRDTAHQAYPYIIQAHRMTANEMQAYLIGVYNGVRASRDQVVNRTMTVGELIYLLESRFDEDQPIVFSHDGGYTYGALREENISESEEE